MRCHKAKDYISQEMDEHLPPDVTVNLTEHLDSCADCRRFRADLLLGRRAMSATTPELPENFEWKLQLKLNQTLQRTAGETAYPWAEPAPDNWRWFRNFGAAAAMGMAAVLALAVFLGPDNVPGESGQALSGGTSSGVVRSISGGAGNTDRLPLFVDQSRRGGFYGVGSQHPVSAGGFSQSSGSRFFDRGWSGHNTNDLRTIQRLRIQNSQLNRDLFQQQQMIQGMRGQLDTVDTNALELELE
ncbi:MAG: zf-HC2 domain-containing protein [Candidatus Krumholzibacteria bacterium]|nr:zf-HC2 domain-containing protein [Candidatus Krumholzibacteria bacterium]